MLNSLPAIGRCPGADLVRSRQRQPDFRPGAFGDLGDRPQRACRLPVAQQHFENGGTQRRSTLIAAELVFGVSSGSGRLGWFVYENKSKLDIPQAGHSQCVRRAAHDDFHRSARGKSHFPDCRAKHPSALGDANVIESQEQLGPWSCRGALARRGSVPAGSEAPGLASARSAPGAVGHLKCSVGAPGLMHINDRSIKVPNKSAR
jgi:hypothetical protein